MFKRSRLGTARVVEAMRAAADRAVVLEPDREVAELIDTARTGSADDVDRLGAVLVARALSDARHARVLLGAIGHEPTVLVRLDGIARRFEAYDYQPPRRQSWVGQACSHFDTAEGRLDPATIAVTSLAADGRVRERAVAAMSMRPVPELVPFLVLRTADWAAPVRERACAALALALYQRPADVVAAGPIAARLSGRLRSDFALSQVRAVLPRLTDEQFTHLLTSSHPIMRRLAAQQARRLRLPVLVDLALAEHDPRTRDQLAETAAREALWSGRHEFLHRLAAARSADVRAIALAGLLRAGLADQAARHLADPSPLVRATARFAARKADIDVLEHYRALTRSRPAEPGALLGLAEATVSTNASGAQARELIEPHLADDAPSVRAAAVTALRLLGSSEQDLLLPLLADPAPAVVRAAAAAIASSGARLEPSRLLALMADPARPAGARRALYRLCQRQDAAVRLAAARTAVTAADAKLVGWAARDLQQMTTHP